MTMNAGLATQPPSLPAGANAGVHIDSLPTSGPESRRTLLRGMLRRGAGMALGAAAGLAPRSAAAAGGTDPRAAWASLPNRLVRRVTLGLTPAEAARAAAMGYGAYLEAQLNPSLQPDGADQWVASNCPLLALNAAGLRASRQSDVYLQLLNATLYRAIFSTKQLQQRLVELWTDHFNIDFRKPGALKAADDRDVIRANALGSFPAMLRASAHSPAMLFYLDNAISRRQSPNLNYAREIMELHTLGVNGGYTEEDVREVARCFTGWTMDMRDGPTWGTFVFDATLHDTGAKRVLGVTIPAGGGQRDGEMVLDILAAHPSTSRRVARKLVTWLLDEDAPSGPVEAAAAVYRSTGGDIRSMVRTILTPENLAAAPAKLKRPFHLLVSAARAAGTGTMTMEMFRGQLMMMGQPLFEWTPPNGYPDTADYWSGLMTARWNFAAWFSGSAGGALPAINSLRTARAVADTLDAALFAGEMPAAEKTELLAYLRPDPPAATRIREGLALALSSPGFQWF